MNQNTYLIDMIDSKLKVFNLRTQICISWKKMSSNIGLNLGLIIRFQNRQQNQKKNKLKQSNDKGRFAESVEYGTIYLKSLLKVWLFYLCTLWEIFGLPLVPPWWWILHTFQILFTLQACITFILFQIWSTELESFVSLCLYRTSFLELKLELVT